ncbi:MAG: GDSL-type esterase/lipase family protein [Sandaracinaceae bacterium]
MDETPPSPQHAEPEPPRPGAHPAGVGRVFAVAAFSAVIALAPYTVAGLETFQVWRPGDPPPFRHLLQRQPRGASLASAFRRSEPAFDDTDDDALMAAAPLPAAVQAAPSPRPEPATAAAPDVLPPLDPAAYEGLTRELEDPAGGMRAFFRRLAQVHRGDPDALARISLFGTSTNGADRVSSQLRHLLQRRFGDGGKGWVPVAAGWRYQRHQDVEWTYDNWRTYVVNRHDGPLARYGYGGVVAINKGPGSRSTFATAPSGVGSQVARYRLFYQAWPGGGELTATLDEGPSTVLDTRAATVEDRVLDLDVFDGPHQLTIRPSGQGDRREDLRLYGVVMERGGPGVVVDGLALIGAFTRVLLYWDPDHLQRQIELREPDLFVFWLGANDAVSESVPYERELFRERYEEILARFRLSRPEASCLVMSILDKGYQEDDRIRTRPRVPGLVQTQREVAEAAGCAFFDTFEAMGGHGTMRRWHRARPRLVTDDLGHLTEPGSRVVGTLLTRALLKAYADWIAAGEPAPSGLAEPGQEPSPP